MKTRHKSVQQSTKAVAYARVSTDRQAKEGISLEAQEERMRKEAEHRGLELVEVFVDAGVSGKNTERPELQRMLEMVRRREVGYVIIPKLDRLGRNTRDLIDLVEELTEHGAELLSLHETLDTKTAMGRFTLRLFASLAEMEREMIVERVVETMRHCRDTGRSTGEPPYGKRLMDPTAAKGHPDYGKLVDDGYEQAVIEAAIGWRRAGLSLQKIADELNQMGSKTRNDGPWKKQYVHRILNASSPVSN